MSFYTSLISSHSCTTPFSFSKVLGTSKSHNGFLVSTHVQMSSGFDICYLVRHQTDLTAFGCLCLRLLTLSLVGLLSRSHNFSQRPRFLGDKKHASLKGVGESIDILVWPLAPNRKISWDFVYLQPHFKSCPWSMIGSASPDKLRISVPIHYLHTH